MIYMCVHSYVVIQHKPFIYLIVYPPPQLASSFSLNPMVEVDDLPMSLQCTSLKTRKKEKMRVVMVNRDAQFLHILPGALLCLTLSHVKPSLDIDNQKARLAIRRCAREDDDPKQWFLSVHGVTLGVHSYSLLGQLRPYLYPEYCVQRVKGFDVKQSPLQIKCDNGTAAKTENLLEFGVQP